MKKILTLILLMVMLSFGSAFGISESITVADTAIGITAAYIPTTQSGCWGWSQQKAYCTLETAQVRFWSDGTTPTSSVGHIMNAGDNLTLNSCSEMYGFKAIRTGATSGVLRCTYE